MLPTSCTHPITLAGLTLRKKKITKDVGFGLIRTKPFTLTQQPYCYRHSILHRCLFLVVQICR